MEHSSVSIFCLYDPPCLRNWFAEKSRELCPTRIVLFSGGGKKACHKSPPPNDFDLENYSRVIDALKINVFNNQNGTQIYM